MWLSGVKACRQDASSVQAAPFSEHAGRPAGMQQASVVLQAGSRQAAGSSRQEAGRQQANIRQAAGKQSIP